MKTCSRCRTEKDLSAFYPNRAARDGRHNYCIPCFKAYYAARANNPTVAKRCRAKPRPAPRPVNPSPGHTRCVGCRQTLPNENFPLGMMIDPHHRSHRCQGCWDSLGANRRTA